MTVEETMVNQKTAMKSHIFYKMVYFKKKIINFRTRRTN